VIRLFCGYDEREAVGYHVFAQSVLERCSGRVSLTPLHAGNAPAGSRDGSNAFTYSRFLVPWLCGFKGHAIFVDGSDMLLRADLEELWALRDPRAAVQVVKHDYRTSAKRKYVGTEMESDNRDYPRKNWSSVVIWNCGNFLNRCLTPEFVAQQTGSYLHRFAWLNLDRELPASEGVELVGDRIGDRIGELPGRWNVLVGEMEGGSPAPADTAIAHWTLGVPGIPAYAGSAFAREWFDTLERSVRKPKVVYSRIGDSAEAVW